MARSTSRQPLQNRATNIRTDMDPRPSGKRHVDVVDLTVSDDEDSRPSKIHRSTQDSGYQTQSSQPTQAQRDQWIALEEDEGDELVVLTQEYEDSVDAHESYERYGTLHTKVVGIRYYNGIASVGEYVNLKREPGNQYDENAIRVDNIRRKQVGHLPRQVAGTLAKYFDQRLLVVDALLSGERGTFDVPIDLGLYGPRDPTAKARLKEMMQRDRLPMQNLLKSEKEEEKRRKAELAKVARMRPAAAGSSSQQWNAGMDPFYDNVFDEGPTMQELMAGSQTFNPRDIGEHSEKFGQSEEDLAALPKADQPERIATQLLPYQLQALAWLFEKENLEPPRPGSKDIVQLWRRSPKGQRGFTNIATNFTQNESPKLASGGILADDMGLGKTLEMISLIVTDMERFKLGEESDQRATLVVAPVSVMSNWRDQIAQHVDSKHPLNILIYHGINKQRINSRYIRDNKVDVVITTYGTLSVEYLPGGKKSKPAPVPRSSGLFSIDWRRIVLDEGHTIRNPNTKNALAATNVMARSRWVLTGTPIINNLKDLYSLLRFIGISGGLEQLGVFSGALIRPMKHRSEAGVVLLQAIMSTLCLRRKKEMPFIDLRLPELTEYIHRIQFLPQERKRYLALQAEAQGMLRNYQMRAAEGQGTKARDAYNHLLEILLRLRQNCNHWRLCPERMSKIMQALENEKTLVLNPQNRKALQEMLQLQIESREPCPVCLEDLTGHEPVITHCAHTFCRACITRVIEAQGSCPMCRAPLPDEDKLVEPAAGLGEAMELEQTMQEEAEAEASSSKVDALMSILAATHRQEAPKVVVFSQWTSFLTLLEPFLFEAGYKYTRLDGTMAVGDRDFALHAFDDASGPTILLASLGVCAVGLNLVAANTVVLCDSWWAPAIEDQAVDRVHRLGQKRDCTVWRLVMEESFEQHVLGIQAEKRKLMMTAFNETTNKRSGGRENRIRDIQRLLGSAS